MEEKTKGRFFNRKILKEWYIKKGLILIDIFIIIAFIQYFVFEGSFNAMILWVKGFFQFMTAID